MKLSLQLKLGQQLVMTPQLQQAIKLLQLSTIDLQQEIQEALDTNPMLEVQEGSSESDAAQADGLNGHETDTPRGDSSENDVSALSDDIPDELPVDTQWEDVY